MPKKNPKRNPAHVERVNRKRGLNNAPITPVGFTIGNDRMEDRNATPGERSKFRETRQGSGSRSGRPRCGLCGKTTHLTKTECCDQWICDDEHQYVLFSYDTNSCHRNHDRYTLCASHHHEGHRGKWQDCPKCREDVETEMYVWYGTNEYNFEKLPNPPAFKPTKCAKCKKVIHLGEEGYTVAGKEYFCERCGGIAQLLQRGTSSLNPKE